MKIVPTTMKATALAVLLVIGGAPIGEAHAAAGSTVDVTMSNFRYCTTPTCSPADQGYVRSSSGPVAGSDNPNSIVDVPEGGTVQWIYRDVGPGSCDFFADRCPGHNVRFEDGTPEGTKIGAARSRSGPTTIVTTVTQKPGTLIRYFCSVNGHDRIGMTGILRVVAPPASLLTAAVHGQAVGPVVP
jgi:plastocyanin